MALLQFNKLWKNAYLGFLKPHVTADDVEVVPTFAEALNIFVIKEGRIKELALLSPRQRKGEVLALAVAIKDVHDGAACRFVRLEEYDVRLGLAFISTDTGATGCRDAGEMSVFGPLV